MKQQDITEREKMTLDNTTNTSKTSTTDIDTIINATILIAGGAEGNEIIKSWVGVADLAIALSLGVRDSLITGLTTEGEQVIRQAFVALAESIGASEDKLVDIAYGVTSDTYTE